MHTRVNSSIHTYAHRYISTETHTYIDAWIDRLVDREIGHREVAWSSEEVQGSFCCSLLQTGRRRKCRALSVAVCCRLVVGGSVGLFLLQSVADWSSEEV